MTCQTHVANADQIISKAFQGRHGQAYLFNTVVNVILGSKEENRNLLSGLHKVCDVHCICCNTLLGWKYLEAFEDSQKYKVGRFILERALIAKEKQWN